LVLLECLALVGSSAHAVTRPGAITIPSNGLTAVVVSKSYAAWRIHLTQAASIPITIVDAHTGDGSIAWVQGAGGGGLGYANLQVGFNGIGLHEALGVGAGGSNGDIAQPGDYWAVAIVGGGTVPAGAAFVRFKTPPGSTVLGFTSGPAIDLTDANFTSGGGKVLVTPVMTAYHAHGSVRKTFTHGLNGLFVGFNPAHISYTDPGGNGHVTDVETFFWFDSAPGTYSFHIDEDVPLTQEVLGGPNSFALLADIQLP
jgi:hypothetical protein